DLLAPILNDNSFDSATALHESNNSSLALAASSSNAASALRDMHVPCFAADEGLIDFYFTAHLGEGAFLQGQADAMKHEPRGALHDSKITAQFIAADSVLAVHEKPEGSHPLIHSQRAVLENGSNLHGELLLTFFAEPEATGRDERVADRVTTGASNLAIRPAEFNRISKAAVRIGKVSYGFLQGLWGFVSSCVHAQNIQEFSLCVK